MWLRLIEGVCGDPDRPEIKSITVFFFSFFSFFSSFFFFFCDIQAVPTGRDTLRSGLMRVRYQGAAINSYSPPEQKSARPGPAFVPRSTCREVGSSVHSPAKPSLWGKKKIITVPLPFIYFPLSYYEEDSD